MRLFLRSYMLLLFAVSMFLAGCSTEEKNGESKEEKISEEDKVKDLVEIFFSNLINGNIDLAKGRATKASYSSINFLGKVLHEFQSIYFSQVKKCEIEDDVATCVCEFNYYNEDFIEKEVVVRRFEEEWLVDFQLGENFDNIFVYDYSYTKTSEMDDAAQVEFSEEAKVEFRKIIGRITSSYIKLGFAYSDNVASVDSLYGGSNDYGYSELLIDGLIFSSTYDFADGKLSNFYMELDNATAGVDMKTYFKSTVSLCTEEMGDPFNIPVGDLPNAYSYTELRWFVKSYNEVLTLRNNNDYISITLTEIP